MNHNISLKVYCQLGSYTSHGSSILLCQGRVKQILRLKSIIIQVGNALVGDPTLKLIHVRVQVNNYK